MRILLDAKDLINVIEHSNPMSAMDFHEWLERKNAVLVYSMQNIRGIAGPIGHDAIHLSRIEGYLNLLEELPHRFIRADIDRMELESAAKCFTVGRDYDPIDPYVVRFDQVFPAFAGYGRPTYRLRDTVSAIWKACPEMFEPRPDLQKIFGIALSFSRRRPQKSKQSRESLPLIAVVESLQSLHRLEPTTATEIGKRLEADRSCCPGLRLIHGLGAAISANRTYLARQDDVFDVSQIAALPYVEAATVDRTMLDYLSRTRRTPRLSRTQSATKPLLFRSVQSMLNLL